MSIRKQRLLFHGGPWDGEYHDVPVPLRAEIAVDATPRERKVALFHAPGVPDHTWELEVAHYKRTRIIPPGLPRIPMTCYVEVELERQIRAASSLYTDPSEGVMAWYGEDDQELFVLADELERWWDRLMGPGSP